MIRRTALALVALSLAGLAVFAATAGSAARPAKATTFHGTVSAVVDGDPEGALRRLEAHRRVRPIPGEGSKGKARSVGAALQREHHEGRPERRAAAGADHSRRAHTPADAGSCPDTDARSHAGARRAMRSELHGCLHPAVPARPRLRRDHGAELPEHRDRPAQL